jgi:hypothetical protein
LSLVAGVIETYTSWEIVITRPNAPTTYGKATEEWQTYPMWAIEYRHDAHWSARLSQFHTGDKGTGTFTINGRTEATYMPSITQGNSFNLSLGYTF